MKSEEFYIKVSEWIIKQAFQIVNNEKLQKNFKYRPNIIASQESTIKAYYIRRLNNVREEILQLISQTKPIPNYSIENFLVFEEKPTSSTIKLSIQYGIGIVYKMKKSFKIFSESKTIGKSLTFGPVRKKRLKMRKTDVFLSSKQNLPERAAAIQSTRMINRSIDVPIFPKIVEDDPRYNEMSGPKLNELIELCQDESDYVACFLSDVFSEIVSWETKRAISKLGIENVMIFIKSDKTVKDNWKDLITFIQMQQVLNSKTVKYIEYIDVKDFESKYFAKIMNLIAKIHKEMGIPFLDS